MSKDNNSPTATNVTGVITTPPTTTSIIGVNATPPDPWGVVAYEIRMCFSDTLTKPQVSRALDNAAAESRLLQIRNLCDIFLGIGRQPDNIHLSPV
jgi:hypothetical protein